MKVLIVCSGNTEEGQVFDLKMHHAFIYDQVEALKIHGIQFEFFFINEKGIIGYLKNIRRLKKKINLKFDLIHAHYGLSSLLANLQRQIPVVTTFHGSDINYRSTFKYSKLAHRLSAASIFVSDNMKKKVHYDRKNYTIPCGVDLSVFYPAPSNKLFLPNVFNPECYNILFSSAFSNSIKNYDLALAACLSAEHIIDKKINLIELRGYTRAEVNMLMNASDCVILTSKSEGSPQFIKEAMACNRPIISTDVGDVKDVFGDTKGCFLCSFNPEDVAKKICMALEFSRILGHTEGRQRIIELGLDSESIAKRVLNVYRMVMGKVRTVIATAPFIGQTCLRGVWDESVPNIKFNKDGVSNYALLHDKLCEAYPRGEQGKIIWKSLVQKIKFHGKGKRYDCIIGVSGGTDSSYLMHIAKEEGLRPLAINLDNGWNSNIALKNIEKVTSALDIDLETYVINYEEIKDLLKSYMYAGLPWIDMPSDLAIKSILYKIAAKERIRYILRGNDFRSEGSQPTEWTYGDGRQLKFIQHRYGKTKLSTFPNYTASNLIYYGLFRKIKSIYPFYYIDYNKSFAQKFLINRYDWEYYGGHHHENLFTKFAISIWMFDKFGIDKRKITLSAQVLSKEISRDEAIQKIENLPCLPEEKSEIIEYVIKKLDLTQDEFNKIMQNTNHSYSDYPSYFKILNNYKRISRPLLKLIFNHKPQSFFKAELIDNK